MVEGVSSVVVQDLTQRRREPHLHRRTHQRVRHTRCAPHRAVSSSVSLCDLEWLDPGNFPLEPTSRVPKIDVSLQVEPELGRRPKQLAEAE